MKILTALIGVICLLFGLWELRTIIPEGTAYYPERKLLSIGSAFDNPLPIEKEEITRVYRDLEKEIQQQTEGANRWRVVGEVCVWFGFICSSILTIVAGSYGKFIKTPEDDGPQAKSKEAQEDENLVEIKTKFLKTLGILAAIVTVSTGAGDRANSASDDLAKKASENFKVAAKGRVLLQNAKTEEEALEALNTLKEPLK